MNKIAWMCCRHDGSRDVDFMADGGNFNEHLKVTHGTVLGFSEGETIPFDKFKEWFLNEWKNDGDAILGNCYHCEDEASLIITFEDHETFRIDGDHDDEDYGRYTTIEEQALLHMCGYDSEKAKKFYKN